MDEAKSVVQIKDERPEWHWWTRIPNIILEKVRHPYEFKLYFVIKKIAQDDGICWLTTQNLADIAGMSVGKVSEARKELENKGLIRCEMRKPINTKTGKPSRGRPCYHITIVDIWDENERRWQEIRGQGIPAPDQENGGFPSSDERFSSPHEGYPSLGEATKNEEEEPGTRDTDDVDKTREFLTDLGLNEPLLTEIANSHDLAWCQAAGSEVDSPGGIVHLHRQGWQPSGKGRRSKPRRGSKEDRYRYFKGEYAEYIER